MGMADLLQWIWHPNDDGRMTPGQAPLYFLHKLRLNELPAKCWIQIYSGTGYRFFVNGVKVGYDWYSGHATYRHDLKPFLRQGINVLAIELYRGHVHPGLLVVGKMAMPGGEHVIKTSAGTSWLVSDKLPCGWPNPNGDTVDMYPAACLTDILSRQDDPKLKQLGNEFSTFDLPAFKQQLCRYFNGRTAEDLIVSGKRVVAVKNAGFFPVMQRLPDGRLAAVLRYGGAHISIEGKLGIVFSSDNGQNWGSLQMVAQGSGDYRNPAFGILADGTLIVAFCICPAYDKFGNWTPGVFSGPLELMLTLSRDGGRNWIRPEPLVSEYKQGLSPFGKMVTLSDGSVLMSVYGRFAGQDSAKTCCGILRSADSGTTWQLQSIIAEGYNETALCMLPSGRLMAILRAETEKANLWQSISSDKGKTWLSPREITDALEHPADIIVLEDGRLFLTYSCRHFPYGVQCKLSNDEGNRWFNPQHFILEAGGITEDCGYPSSVVLPRGEVLTVYYSIGSRFDPVLGVHAMTVRYRPEEL